MCVGFVSGGGEYGDAMGSESEMEYPFAGGASSGISITPIGFLVVDEDHVQLLSVSGKSALEKVIETMPQIIYEIKEAVSDRNSNEVE